MTDLFTSKDELMKRIKNPVLLDQLKESARVNESSKPVPLNINNSPSIPFPVDALGESLAIYVRDKHRIINAPLPMCAQSVLATISLAAQPHANVEVDGRTSPISLFFLTVAESGERKSSDDNVTLKPIDDHEHDLQIRYQADLEEYKAREAECLGMKKRSCEAYSST